MNINRKDLMIVLLTSKGICAYCKCDLIKVSSNPHIDHIIPKTKGGKDEISNYMLTCDWCNRVKGNKPKEDFLNYIQPYLDKKVGKKDLYEYNTYLRLQKKYGRSTT